jgi:CheY-like chemotaxis protein
MNLVLNARDAMPKGGHVRIEARPPTTAPSESLRHGDFVEFLVSDDGIGMDEATKSRIFEPFFTTKEVGKGVGLGLSSVYGLVEQLGGKIAVESAPGVGTTFHVFLPRIVGVAETKQVTPTIAHGGRGERVLLVEDESMVRQLLERVLSQAGYQVSSSLTSEAALKFATAGRSFDLIVTDVVMPGLTGPELAAKIEQACGVTPTIFMSGYSEDPALREGRLRSHQRFMPKPFAPPDLLVVIRELLTQYPRRDSAIV